MKKAILVACAVMLFGGAVFGGVISEDPGELSLAAQYWFPGDGDFDLFENGYGLSLSYREWFSFPWGVGVNLGLMQWNVNGNSQAYKYRALVDYDGDALLIPLGASLYFNVIDWDTWNLVIGTGLKYLIVNSDVSVYNSEDRVESRQDVNIDNAVLWDIGIEYEYMVAENAFVVGRGGYQVDLMRADTDYDGVSTRDTSFRGAYISLAGKLLF